MSEIGGETLIDYRTYSFSNKERIQHGIAGAMGSFLISYLFYQSIYICLPISVAGAIVYLLYKKKRLGERKRWDLMLEFKDAADSFVSALVAGYSMENAINEVYRDLTLMYGAETAMLCELRMIRQRLDLHESLDHLLLDLGRRSGVEDIVTFAQIYTTARRSGGNLIRVLKRTADNIAEKIEIQREIQTAIAGKRMEAACMMVIPLLILVYLQVFSPGFLAPLYHGLAGKLFMTVALLVYISAVVWSRAIMNRLQ